ncbi:MAG: tetratricopeptide repeat protein [Phycisphaerae bacterium]
MKDEMHTLPARKKRRRRATASSGALAAFLVVAATRADVIGVAGRPPTIDVRITAFRGGQIEYRISSGREAAVPVEEIDYLQITNWPLFNLAEKQHSDGHVRQAVANYERLLRQIQAPAQGELDRRQLVRCRLLKALDKQGQFDRTVEVYVEILDQEPDLVERLRPSNLPVAGSTFLQAAAASLDAFIRRHGDEEVARFLRRWRQTWPTTTTRPVSGNGATASQPTGTVSAEVIRQLGEAQQLISRGQFDEALKRIDAIRRTSDAAIAELFFWQGKALLGRAGVKDTAEAEIDRKRAGLAFMRVVIHFPGHALAPQSLYEAGAICRQSGKSEQAAMLWSELVRSYPAADEWVGRASQELERMRK